MSQVSDTSASKSTTQRKQDSFESERTETRANSERDVKKTKEQSENIERLETERKSARNEVKRLKQELYGQKGTTSSSEYKELSDERKRLSAFRDEIKAEADKRVSSVERNSEGRAVKSQSREATQVERAVEAQKKSARQEVRMLQEELAQYRSEGHDVDAERAHAKQQTIAEYENDQINERNRIIDSYERQIEHLKDHESELQDHYATRIQETGFENNAKTREQLKLQKAEFIQEAKNEALKRKLLEDTFKAEIKKEESRQESATDHLIAKNNSDLQNAVAAKDQTYKDYLASKNERVDYELKERDQRIQDLQTTDDPLKVSPYVVKRINDAAEKYYYEKLNAANHANKLNLNAVRERDQEDRRDLTNEYRTKFTGVTREIRKELDVKDRQFLNSYDDLSHLHQAKEGTLVEQKRDAINRLSQRQALEMVNAQKQKKEALEVQHDTLNYEKSAAMDDAEQSRRIQDREWAMKANDMRRNLQNQMAEERDQHEKVVGEMKLEFDKKLRDQDRNSKRAVDDRVRAYEHQIKQQELSFREKERFLTEHYEEELDRMKRTNAHLIQKKS